MNDIELVPVASVIAGITFFPHMHGISIVRSTRTPVFLNRRVAARYRALASIMPGRERFSWNLSF